MVETKEWTFIDKAEWPQGEWNDEPDKRQWQDAETGYACLIHRNSGGALCGYVGVPVGHPLHGKDYEDVDVDVHGGLTFADSCHGQQENGRGICHEVCDPADDGVWWLGFDCAHLGDLCPAYEERKYYDSYYKDIRYVTGHVTHLARQLKDASNV